MFASTTAGSKVFAQSCGEEAGRMPRWCRWEMSRAAQQLLLPACHICTFSTKA
jgi:hypothetical protein